jgi:hypothetical protein
MCTITSVLWNGYGIKIELADSKHAITFTLWVEMVHNKVELAYNKYVVTSALSSEMLIRWNYLTVQHVHNNLSTME